MKDSDGLSNRFNSYQQSGTYVPPGKTFADQQTNVLSETVQTQYHAEETANAVMTHLHAQRQQIQGANENVWDMREATEQTKKELMDLHAKYRQKKLRLYVWIAVVATLDILLFFRLLRCRGSFFC
jgi:chlorite dismutase